MFALLFLLFVATPIAELFLLFRIGRIVGPAPTLAFVIAMGVFGAALAKSQGRRVVEQWQQAIASGRVPEEGVIGGLLILLGGFLMIVPGVLTDVVGLLLLVPPLRRSIAAALSGYLANQMAAGKLHVSMGGRGERPSNGPTQVGRVIYRPGDVIDTEGEDVK